MDELEQLQSQIQELQKRAEHLASQKKAEAIQDVKAKIHQFGLTARDLGLAPNGEVKKIHVPVKYRIGDLTWTGRGRAPKFIDEYLAQGGNLDDILVKP